MARAGGLRPPKSSQARLSPAARARLSPAARAHVSRPLRGLASRPLRGLTSLARCAGSPLASFACSEGPPDGHPYSFSSYYIDGQLYDLVLLFDILDLL